MRLQKAGQFPSFRIEAGKIGVMLLAEYLCDSVCQPNRYWRVFAPRKSVDHHSFAIEYAIADVVFTRYAFSAVIEATGPATHQRSCADMESYQTQNMM